MARASIAMSFCGFLVVLFFAGQIVRAADPDLVVDFAIPPGMNASNITGDFFTFSGFRSIVPPRNGTFKPTKAFADAFPALNGLGISSAWLEFHPGAENPPHTHPRATELLCVLKGSLTVGIIDTTNKLYNKTLLAGDLFVFPKGLVHFQMNPSTHDMAFALASFNSANPGTVSLPGTLFGSGISDVVLTEAFKVPEATVLQLEVPFASPMKHVHAGHHW